MKKWLFKYAIPGEIFSQEKKLYLQSRARNIKLITSINTVKIMNQCNKHIFLTIPQEMISRINII